LPDLDGNLPTINRAVNNNLITRRITGSLNRCIVSLDTAILGYLLTVLVDSLVEVTQKIKQADRYKWQAQITCCLAMITGQNPEATGIDRKTLVVSELRTKIGDEITVIQPGRLVAINLLLQIRIILSECATIGVQEGVISGCQFQQRLVYTAQEYLRIPASLPPQTAVEGSEQLAGWPVPAEPEIGSQVTQTLNALGQSGLYMQGKLLSSHENFSALRGGSIASSRIMQRPARCRQFAVPAL
jgi:hypothetical protein